MDQVTLHARLRTEMGSRATRRLRRTGQVPAVVYGRDLDPVSVIVDNKALFTALHTEAGFNALISVEVENRDAVFTVAREIQRDPVRDNITHLDFIKVSLDEEIQSNVPVSYQGTPVPVRDEGALVETIATTVLVSSLPTAVPSFIEFDISDLVVGDTVTLADLPAIEGVEYLDDPVRPLLTVLAPRLIEEEEEEVLEDEELEEGEEGAEGTEAVEGAEAEDGAEPNVLLVVGLRNPGAKYEATRHNVGGQIVDALVKRHGARFKKAKRFISAEVAEIATGGGRMIAVLPTTYMNESGDAIAPIARYYKVGAGSLIVVHDDIDLPFAKLRVQRGGGAGGNNGVKSVAKSVGTQDFWRLKCGVGRPPGRMDPANFVLRPFAVSERVEIDLMTQYAVDLIEQHAAEGGDAARQRAGEINALLRGRQ